MSNFKDGVSVILAGTAKWAKVTEATGPNDLSEKYQLDLYLDDASEKTLRGVGADSIIKDKGEGLYITAKSKLLPKVYDSSRQGSPSPVAGPKLAPQATSTSGFERNRPVPANSSAATAKRDTLNMAAPEWGKERSTLHTLNVIHGA